jgi:hypothetical protein
MQRLSALRPAADGYRRSPCFPDRLRPSVLAVPALSVRRSVGMAISARRPAVVALVTVPAGLVSAAEMISGRPIPILRHWNDKPEPFRVVNRYHVSPTMDNARIAFQSEVSREGGDWAPLDFRHAPDQPDQAPAFVAPPQPRVAWLLWFVPRGPLSWVGSSGFGSSGF